MLPGLGVTTKFGVGDGGLTAGASCPSTTSVMGISPVGKSNVVLVASGKNAMPPVYSSLSHTVLGCSCKEHETPQKYIVKRRYYNTLHGKTDRIHSADCRRSDASSANGDGIPSRSHQAHCSSVVHGFSLPCKE